MIPKNLPIALSNSGLWVDATDTSIQFFCQKGTSKPVEVPLKAVDLTQGKFTHLRSEWECQPGTYQYHAVITFGNGTVMAPEPFTVIQE